MMFHWIIFWQSNFLSFHVGLLQNGIDMLQSISPWLEKTSESNNVFLNMFGGKTLLEFSCWIMVLWDWHDSQFPSSASCLSNISRLEKEKFFSSKQSFKTCCFFMCFLQTSAWGNFLYSGKMELTWHSISLECMPGPHLESVCTYWETKKKKKICYFQIVLKMTRCTTR